MEKTKQGNVPFRPLGLVKEVLEGLGDDVSYAYEDLVFIEHNSYLLQFGERGEELFFCENDDAAPDELGGKFEQLVTAFAATGIELRNKGRYSVSVSGDEELQLTFL